MAEYNFPRDKVSWAFESINRRNRESDTNDLELDVNISDKNFPIEQIAIGSLELPLNQYIVESLWNKIFYDEGVPSMEVAATGEGDSSRRFTLRFPMGSAALGPNATGPQVSAVLPPSLNPVTGVSVSESGELVVMTLHHHGLELGLSEWNWNDPILMSGLPGGKENGFDLTLESTTENITILDESAFSIKMKADTARKIASQTAQLPAPLAFVQTPRVPSVQILARIVNRGLLMGGLKPGILAVDFDPRETQFVINVINKNAIFGKTKTHYLDAPGFQTRAPGSYVNTGSAMVVGTGLSDLMGFTHGMDVPLSYDINEVECRMRAGSQYGGLSCVEVNPGNYDASFLGGEILNQWNAFYFEPGSSSTEANAQRARAERGGGVHERQDSLASIGAQLIPSSSAGGINKPVSQMMGSAIFTFTTPTARTESFAIPFGSFTPDTLGLYIQDMMSRLDGTTSYIVEYEKRAYSIASGDGKLFSLEFDLPTASQIATVLGFDAVSYRGNSNYTSAHPVSERRSSCNGRYDSSTLQVLNRAKQKRYVISTAAPRPLSARVQRVDGNTVAFTSLSAGTAQSVYAHGFQVGDHVSFESLQRQSRAPSMGVFSVSNVADAFTFSVNVGSLGPLFSSGDTYLSVSSASASSVTFHFGRKREINGEVDRTFKAELLGFPRESIFPNPYESSSLMSTVSYQLEPPKHLLVVIEEPKISTNNSHTYLGDNVHQVLGKIVLYPPFRLERMQEMTATLSQIGPIAKMRIRILNPDHTPYQFHRSEWSGTLIFIGPRGNLTLPSI